MKTYKFLILLLIGCLVFVSCEDAYLDDPAPTSSVNESVIFSSKVGVEAFLAGITRRARRQFSTVDTGGVYSLYYARSVKGNDVILKPTWYGFDYDNDNREPNYRRPIFNWEFPYYVINQINIGIQGLSSSALPAADKDELMAQFLGLRAYYYFQLAMEFCHPPAYDPNFPAPPVYTEPATDSKAMSTVSLLFDQIKADLTTAASSAAATSKNKTYLNKSSIEGIKARVHLYLGEYAEAAASANAAKQGYSLSNADYTGGFDNLASSEVMFGMAQTNDQSNYYYIAPHVMTDFENGPYKGAFFNNDFVSSFTSTDVRNTFYNYYGVPTSLYYAWVTSKFYFAFDSDMILMRSPEMMLIEAESLARTGQEIAAATLLFDLQSNRDANATASGNTGQALIDEILLERRKELYCEIGVEWLDAKRLQQGITRTGNHRILKNLSANDNRFILKVPQKEIDANDLIDDTVNANR